MTVGTKSVATFTGTGSLVSPLTNIEISSAFGSRGNRRHQGVDMRSPTGTPIHAADDGVVTTAKYQGSYGNLIILSHGKGLETYYAHCSSMAISEFYVIHLITITCRNIISARFASNGCFHCRIYLLQTHIGSLQHPKTKSDDTDYQKDQNHSLQANKLTIPIVADFSHNKCPLILLADALSL
ncbi:hypothetical protein FACS1894127_0860 [Clostridia bacterium]|nr:hypothetical protein FACS1894127_0860 [Clostridia bacterium]